MSFELGWVLIPLFICLAIVMTAWQASRSRSMLQQWADQNNLTLLESRRTYWGGPFWWRTSRGQLVFRITIRDGGGQERRGYARVGGFFWGIYSKKIAVEWDKPTDP